MGVSPGLVGKLTHVHDPKRLGRGSGRQNAQNRKEWLHVERLSEHSTDKVSGKERASGKGQELEGKVI